MSIRLPAVVLTCVCVVNCEKGLPADGDSGDGDSGDYMSAFRKFNFANSS